MKNRIAWVDIAKYIGIMFVMLSHLESDTQILRTLYTPFYLSVFFFASGYLYKEEDSFGQFAYKKIRGLLIPWLVFSVFNILLSQLISFNAHNGLLSEIAWNFLQIRGKGDGLWFVAALFVAFFPFYALINLTKKITSKVWVEMLVGISLVLSVISITYSDLMNPTLFPWNSSALPWHLDYIFQAMFYMVLGYLFKAKYEEYFDRCNTRKNRWYCLILYFLVVYIPYFSRKDIPIVFDAIYQYISEILGIIVVVAICKVVNTNQYISFVGKNTLIYFAFHGKVYSLLQTVLKKVVGKTYNMILSNTISSSLSDGTLWEAETALYFRDFCLPDCTVVWVTADYERSNRTLS